MSHCHHHQCVKLGVALVRKSGGRSTFEGPTAVDPELPERSGHRKPHGCPKEKESLPPRKRYPHPAALPAGTSPSDGICINIKKLFTFAAIVL